MPNDRGISIDISFLWNWELTNTGRENKLYIGFEIQYKWYHIVEIFIRPKFVFKVFGYPKMYKIKNMLKLERKPEVAVKDSHILAVIEGSRYSNHRIKQYIKFMQEEMLCRDWRVIHFEPNCTIYDILVSGEFFKSKGEAKKNWKYDKDIVPGLTGYEDLGRQKRYLSIFNYSKEPFNLNKLLTDVKEFVCMFLFFVTRLFYKVFMVRSISRKCREVKESTVMTDDEWKSILKGVL